MIRKAEDAEFLACLQDESIKHRLDIVPKKIVTKNNYVVDIDGSKLFFCYWKVGRKTAEMHVAAIKEHRKNVKFSIKLALNFMRRKGFKKIITSAPEIYKETVNMAKNLGFVEHCRRHHPGYCCDLIYLEKSL